MADKKPLTKRNLIDKADTRMLIFAGIAIFVFVFSMVSSKSLVNQLSYQNRLTTAKQSALTQLKSDITAENALVSSYQSFVSSPTNVIDGSSTGQGANTGDNGQIVLDALPSKYDFPAMLTSVNNLLATSGVKIDSITGTDNQVAQEPYQTSPTPTPIPMVFQFTVEGAYQNFQNLFATFQKSTRPFQFQSVAITANTNTNNNQTTLTLVATVQTFYQPEKIFNITSEVVQ